MCTGSCVPGGSACARCTARRACRCRRRRVTIELLVIIVHALSRHAPVPRRVPTAAARWWVPSTLTSAESSRQRGRVPCVVSGRAFRLSHWMALQLVLPTALLMWAGVSTDSAAAWRVAPRSAPTCEGNVTVGVCCVNSTAIGLRSTNNTVECCAACRNETDCTAWTLQAPPGGTVGLACALFTACPTAQPGNCTKGVLSRPPPAPSPPPAPPHPKPPPVPPGGLSFRFVATWRGLHPEGAGIDGGHNVSAQSLRPEQAVGECTCSLIAPLWIITAEHCAERVLKHERTDVKVNFHGDTPHVERGVTHCIAANHADVDIAICKLKIAVHAFPPVAVNPEVMKTGHAPVEVLTVGTMGGLHHPRKRLGYERNGAHLHVTKGGGMKAGDSGAPWVMQARGTHYLVGVAHGSGIAGQVSHIRAFLDEHIGGIHWAKP